MPILKDERLLKVFTGWHQCAGFVPSPTHDWPRWRRYELLERFESCSLSEQNTSDKEPGLRATLIFLPGPLNLQVKFHTHQARSHVSQIAQS